VAFLLFRAFDILKPPPIRRIDRQWQGPVGVMADDLLAAAYTVLVVAFWQRLG
jgi:phosphatidylglycerophosphatase A